MGKKKKALKIYEKKKAGTYVVSVHKKEVENLPVFATLTLSTMVSCLLESGIEHIEVMRACTEVVKKAWMANGLSFDPVEYVDDIEDDRKDRMGL